MDVKECRRAGTAVEIFVGAANGEICIAGVKMDGNRANRMTQIPKYKRAFCVSKFGDALHIVEIAAFEGDMRERDKRGIFIDGVFERGDIWCDVLVSCADKDNFVAVIEVLFDTLQDVQVGRKVEGIGNDM